MNSPGGSGVLTCSHITFTLNITASFFFCIFYSLPGKKSSSKHFKTDFVDNKMIVKAARISFKEIFRRLKVDTVICELLFLCSVVCFAAKLKIQTFGKY